MVSVTLLEDEFVFVGKVDVLRTSFASRFCIDNRLLLSGFDWKFRKNRDIVKTEKDLNNMKFLWLVFVLASCMPTVR